MLDAPTKLREYRRNRGLTLEEVAVAVRCHPTMISALEHGRRTPGLRLAVALETLTAGWIPATSWTHQRSDAA